MLRLIQHSQEIPKQANTPASNTIPLKLADLPDALYFKILALSKAD